MGLPMEIDEEDDCNKLMKSKTPTTDRSKVDDGVSITSSKKRKLRGIMLSVTKPSYTLKKGIGQDMKHLRWQHRNRLQYLLEQLVRHQNWDEAAGVLSVLLKATYRDNNLSRIRTKYSATLELLQHMGAAKVKPRKIQHVYEIWMKKNLAVAKNKRFLKGKFDVQFEFVLFCLSQGDTDGAYQAVISLLQESDFTKDPIANLVAGLVFSDLWYIAVQKDLQLYDSPESCTPIQSEMSGSQLTLSIYNSSGQGLVEVQESVSPFQQDSNTSIRMGKAISYTKEVVDQYREVPMEVDDGRNKEIPEYEEPHMNSIESDRSGKSRFPHTGNQQYGSIFHAHDLEHLLMPLRFHRTNNFEDFISLQKRIRNDNYDTAVKHLRNALHSTPPAFEALVPLIRMLLLGDQVKEAIEEVESVVQNSDAELPFRLKACLLDHFSQEDVVKMCTCFEDTLKKKPTCSHSLAKLIGLHHDGHYSIEKVLEMIALLLDATTYADCHTWKEFASCLLRLSLCEKDRMSSCVDGYGSGDEDSCVNRSNSIPGMFKDDVSRKNWRFRCRWWSKHHFTQTLLASEVTSGNMELVTYKAAVACHIYGPESAYVAMAREILKKEKKREMLSILKTHIIYAIRLYTT